MSLKSQISIGSKTVIEHKTGGHANVASEEHIYERSDVGCKGNLKNTTNRGKISVSIEPENYLTFFERKQSRLMPFPCCLCVSVSPISTFEYLNQSLLNLICIS
jgi:hypothetical protein